MAEEGPTLEYTPTWVVACCYRRHFSRGRMCPSLHWQRMSSSQSHAILFCNHHFNFLSLRLLW